MTSVPMDFMQLIIEGLFTIIMAGIGFIIRGMSSDIKKLTEAISDLRLEMLRDFVGKDEWQRIREHVHELANSVQALQFMAGAEDRRRNREGTNG